MPLAAPTGVRFDAQGLVVAVAQDAVSGTVLMVAYMDRIALERTLATGQAHFWSRSRQRLWRKGESSGNVLQVDSVQTDCDGDALLLSVRPAGPTCHLGRRSCFAEPATTIDQLQATLARRRRAPAPDSYTATLLAAGVPAIARKVGEEAIEVILAAHEPDLPHLVAEVADVWYHTAVLLLARGLQIHEVLAELSRRQAGAPAAEREPGTT
ncbi:MAG: bifunctional phosphoribosyl-AMP cyclohydrolase/phosphoribosyl-ATP diphosphatase HisIE [Candidatus Dormibacteria bacterium]